MKTLHTIKYWVAWSLAICVWVAEPFLSAMYYAVTRKLNYYPEHEDNIIIPITKAVFIAIIGAPIWFLICRAAFRNLPGPFWRPKHLPPIHPPKVCSRVFGKLAPAIWVLFRICLCLLIVVAFGFFICVNMVSISDHKELLSVILKSDLSHLSGLVLLLNISSCGWAILWALLAICFIARIMAGKDYNAENRPKITSGMIMLVFVAFGATLAGGGLFLHYKTKHDGHIFDLYVKEQDLYGTWLLDASKFNSKTYTLESFCDFKVIIHPGGSFTAKGVPPGIFFNRSSHIAECAGKCILHEKHNSDYIDFVVHGADDCGPGEQNTAIRRIKGQFVFDLGNGDSIPVVQTSTSTEGH